MGAILNINFRYKHKFYNLLICMILIITVPLIQIQVAYADSMAVGMALSEIGGGALTVAGTVAASELLIAAGLIFVAGLGIYYTVDWYTNHLNAAQIKELNDIGASGGGVVSDDLWNQTKNLTSETFSEGENIVKGIPGNFFEQKISDVTYKIGLAEYKDFSYNGKTFKKFSLAKGFVSLGTIATIGESTFKIVAITDDMDYLSKISRAYYLESRKNGVIEYSHARIVTPYDAPSPVLTLMVSSAYSDLAVGMVYYDNALPDKSLNYFNPIYPLNPSTSGYNAYQKLTGALTTTTVTGSPNVKNKERDFKNKATGKRSLTIPVVASGIVAAKILSDLEGKTVTDIENATATVPDTGANTGTNTGTATPSLDLTVPKTATINWEPLKLNASLTQKFPFSIPWDFATAILNFNVPRQVPKWTIDMSDAMIGAKPFVISFEQFDPFAKVVRWGVLILFNIGLIRQTRRLMGD